MNRKIDVYIFHGIEDVVIGFFREDKLINYKYVPKRSLGEELVEGFENTLKASQITLKDIRAIYLSKSFSTWNASRLVTLFVKTIVYFEDILLYSREESQDKLDAFSALKSFWRNRGSFSKVDSIDQVSPLYKKCPNINI